jgi:beta-aspartyl-peptidase (threonine type)
LAAGGNAQQAVIAAVRVLEDDSAFNAGRGSCMNADGAFEMDAGIMRSTDLRSGAVAAAPDLLDPILVAEAVLERSPHCLLAGEGVVRFARQHGVGTFGRDGVWTDKAQVRWERAHVRGDNQAPFGQADTVGAVALDASGQLCVACSTGGVLLKAAGRVGDSPVCGAGFYASSELGAACATGLGEAIGDDPVVAAQAVCERVASDGAATCGLILVTPDGRIAVAHHSSDMSWAVGRIAGSVVSGLSRRESGLL